MKIKSIFTLALCLGLSAVGLVAQDTTFIKGDLNIRYNTRLKMDSSGVPEKETSDIYSLNINVSNSAVFRGNIIHTPFVNGGTFSSNQPGTLKYDIVTDLINYKNPSQVKKDAGKIFGTVPVSEMNVYDFSNGGMKNTIFASGRTFESKYTGVAVGKPPVKKAGFFESAKQDALRLVNGKGASIQIVKYDKMEFQNLSLGSGPFPSYPDSVVSGSMIYDYNRGAWHFQSVTVTYTNPEDGRRVQDNITGNIRWNNSQYDFDVRVNEPILSEASMFSPTAVVKEEDFFTVDNTNPTLTGFMKYKDTQSNGKVISSAITIDLTGNKLTRQQSIYLSKLIFLVSIVPINAE